MTKLLQLVLLIIQVLGQPTVSTTPPMARIPDGWSSRMLLVWDDYSYHVSYMYGGYSKYADDWSLLSWFSMDCGVDNIMMGMQRTDGVGVKYMWDRDGVQFPSWGGCGSSSGYLPLDNEINYSWDWYLPSNMYGGGSINGGTQFRTVTWQVFTHASDGSVFPNPGPNGWIPGPIMGVNWGGCGGPEGFLSVGSGRIHDLNWCQIQPIASFAPRDISGGDNGSGPSYYYSTPMGIIKYITVNHYYGRWNYYSTYCHFEMIKLTSNGFSITHEVHRAESNVSMDVIKNRLYNEQVWLGTATGTIFRYQILPQNDDCVQLRTTGDCLSGDQIGQNCQGIYCNQDMTMTNSSDIVINYAQYAGPQDYTINYNWQGYLRLWTEDPWMEGRHRMRLQIQNSNYPSLQSSIMTQDIIFDITANCKYTHVEYNHTYPSEWPDFHGVIQNMKTPINMALYQDLSLSFSHTYFYRWPPNSCNVAYSIDTLQGGTSLIPQIMTLEVGTTPGVRDVLKLNTNTAADQGTYTFVIRASIREYLANFRTQVMTATITAPCTIWDFKSFTLIPSDVRYQMGVIDEMPLEFSFTYLNPCDCYQNFKFTVKDLTTGSDISTSQKFLRLNFNKFPVGSNTGSASYPRLIVQSHNIADIGTYQVNVYAFLNTSPAIYPASDNIQFTLTIFPDLCLLTTISDQVLPDQYFKIDFNAPPTQLFFLDFQDWVTRDNTGHTCGPRKYELSSTGGGSTGMFTGPGAVPSFIGFLTGNPWLAITTAANPLGNTPGYQTINIFTTNPYAVGVYTVQIIISLSDWPLFYNIQKLIKTFKVTIDSVCLHGEILYSTFPLLLQKVAWTPPAPSTFFFNPVPDLMSENYSPYDGFTFCRQRTYTGFRTTCSDCVTAPTPAAVITFPGTTFPLNAATFMYEKQPPQPPILDTTFTLDVNSQTNYRLYWGLYNLYFKVGFLDYPTFPPQEFSFPAQIVPDCQNAIISGNIQIQNMRTYINTPKKFSYSLMQHDEYNVYNYYCDNGSSTGGLTYSLLDGAGLPSTQAYLVMTVGATGIGFRLFQNDPGAATDVQVPPNPYSFIFRTCLTWTLVLSAFMPACQYTSQQNCYLPSNCKDLPFTVTLDTDCVIQSYNSIDTPLPIETYQVGQAAVTYPINFQVIETPPTCVYPSHWLVMVDGVDRTSSMPTWLTISAGGSTGSIVIVSSSSRDVGKYHIKIYSFIEKIPVYPTSIIDQIPTEVIIELMANPCINTRLTSTINDQIFLFTIAYSNPFTDFTLPGYTDVVTVSGEADCGQIIYTVTGITDANYSSYMTFSANGRGNTITFKVQTRNGLLVGDHNFKIHAMLKNFPSLDPMLGINNFFKIRIASVCSTDVIYRPRGIDTNIKTTIDSSPKVTLFYFVQDSVSTNAGYNDLTEDGGLCGPWNYDIRIGDFYKKSEQSQYKYVIQSTSPQGLATMTAERVLVIDGKGDQRYVGKQEIFITVTSLSYPTVTNEFQVMAWVYNFCSFKIPLALPLTWQAALNAVSGADATRITFPEWKTPTDSDYFQDWGQSYDDRICGNRNFFIQTSTSVAAPSWISFITQKNATSFGYQVDVVVNSISPKDIGSYTLQYCVKLATFLNEQCNSFTVVIHDLSYLTSNKPPWFTYMFSWTAQNSPDFVYTYKLGKLALGLIQCFDLETSPQFLDIRFTITTEDDIPNVWMLTTAQNYLMITLATASEPRMPKPIPFGAGGLFWLTKTQDAGKKFTLEMTCSDGMYLIKQKFKCMIEDPNAKVDVKAVTNESQNYTSTFVGIVNQTSNVTIDPTSLINNTKAKVKFQGRDYTTRRPTVYIKSIECQGTINLRFSDQMVFPKDIETNKVRMKEVLRVEYLSGFYDDEIGYDKNLNNYSWVVILALKRDMQIQMTWKAPGWISQGANFDRLKVTFLEAKAFVSKLGVSIQDDETYISLIDYIPPQIDPRSGKIPYIMSKTLASAGSTLAVSGVAAGMIFWFGASQIWGMINGVQLLIYSPALRIKIPANALVFVQNVIQLATFDYIPMDTIFEDEFDLPNYESITPWFDAVGLQTRQFMLNIGSPWLFLVIACLGILLYPSLKWFSHKTGLLKRQVKWVRQKLMWSYFLVFMITMSLEITLSCLIQYTSLKWSMASSDAQSRRLQSADGSTTFIGEVISSYSAIVVGGVFLIFNLANPILLYRNFKNLNDPVINEPWGSIYSEFKLEKWSLCYPNILMMKRIIFSVLCFYATDNGYVQVMLVQFLSIGKIIYLCLVNPFKDRNSQTFEVLNEVISLLFSYSLMVFNDYLDVDSRYFMGWYLIGIMTLYLSYHIIRLGFIQFTSLVQTLKNKIFLRQLNKLMAKREQLMIAQLKYINQVEPEIELPNRTPRLSNLKFRKQLNQDQDTEVLSVALYQNQILSQVERGQLDKGFEHEFNFNSNTGDFNTGVIYHINQPLDQMLNLQPVILQETVNTVKTVGQIKVVEDKFSVVDSLDVDSISGDSYESEISFRTPVCPAGFVIPAMPAEDIWEEEVDILI